MEKYNSGNCLQLKEIEQEKIKNSSLLIAGMGIGSVIAECALRYGFTTITLLDEKEVSKGDLQAQNYIQADINHLKTDCVTKRLLEINPDAIIHILPCNSIESGRKLKGHYDIAVNTLDFINEQPFLFNETCKKHGIPVLHPFCIGEVGLLLFTTPDGVSLQTISETPGSFNLKLLEYVARYLRFRGVKEETFECIIQYYKNNKEAMILPETSYMNWSLAGLCVNLIHHFITEKEVKVFPKFYISSLLTDKI